MKTRINYWSCSKFANFIRGEKKPRALTLEEWKEWEKKQKKERPIRYWISDTLLNKIQDFIYFPIDLYDSVRYYIKKRFILKTHYLKTGLNPGVYHELDERILHGLFNELVDFVEKDLAHLSKWNKEKKYKFKKGRSKEAAYDYFDWVLKLTQKNEKNEDVESQQAIDSKIIKELYEWWTTIRPNRQDVYEIFTKEKHGSDYYLKIYEMEKKYDEEDEIMMIKLIKIRKSLWI